MSREAYKCKPGKVAGIGIYDQKILSCKSSKEALRLYFVWQHMLLRASEKEWLRQPAYRGTTVSQEFIRYEDFVGWTMNQIGWNSPGFQLDKDILAPGKLHYSPSTCVFVPRQLNILFTNCRAARGEYPVGVRLDKQRKRFIAQIRTFGKQHQIGTFDTPENAFQAYKTQKEAHIKHMAERYRSSIDSRVYEALMAYQVQITD